MSRQPDGHWGFRCRPAPTATRHLARLATMALILLFVWASPVAANVCDAEAGWRDILRDGDGVVFVGEVTGQSDDQTQLNVAVTTWFHPPQRRAAEIGVETHADCSGSSCVVGSDSIVFMDVGTEVIFAGTWQGAGELVRWACPAPGNLSEGERDLYEKAMTTFGLPPTDTGDAAAAGKSTPLSGTVIAAIAWLLGLTLAMAWLSLRRGGERRIDDARRRQPPTTAR
jgi:hypothetical protein